MQINEIRVGCRYGKDVPSGEVSVRIVMERGLEPDGRRWVRYKEEGGQHREGRTAISRFAKWAQFEVK